MSAELTAWSSEEYAVSDCWKPGFWRRMFGRWRGAMQPGARPPGPELPHALERLSFNNGTLWEMNDRGQVREYMALSGVEVITKRSFRDRQNGECEYRFELNLPPDPGWHFYFTQCRLPFVVEFDGSEMILVCAPKQLWGSYSEVKARIVFANEAYACEREDLIARVIAREEELAAAREAEARRRRDLQREFDGLQL